MYTVIESVCAVSFRFLLLRMIVVSFENEKLSRKNGRVAIRTVVDPLIISTVFWGLSLSVAARARH